jgi:branched-chain amino acid transport system permease protein
MSTAGATAETGRVTRPGTRTLIALAVALPVTLWIASEIEMNLFMAFVLWALIAVRTAFHENRLAATATLIALVVWAIVLPFFQESGGGFIEDATLALAYAVMALGLNIIVGFAGLLDLGYVAFFALGALTAGWFMSGFFANASGGEGFSLLVGEPASTLPGIHFNFLVVVVLAILVCTIAGMLIGLPTLRLRGDYIAIVTLAFGEIIGRIVINGDEIRLGEVPLVGSPLESLFGNGSTLTAGRQGITPIDKIDLPFLEPFQSLELRPWYFVALAMVFIALFVNYRLRDSRLGRAWIALREDEVAAASMGVPLVKTKLLAYGTGAAFGGMSGAFLASYLNTVNADQFQFSFSIFVLAMIILGGLGSIEGVVLGAIVLSFINNNLIPDVFNDYPSKIGLDFDLPELSFGIFGFLLVIMMVLRPEGLIPERRRKIELTEGVGVGATTGVGAAEEPPIEARA